MRYILWQAHDGIITGKHERNVLQTITVADIERSLKIIIEKYLSVLKRIFENIESKLALVDCRNHSLVQLQCIDLNNKFHGLVFVTQENRCWFKNFWNIPS